MALVTEANAPVVIMGSVSVMSCAVGALAAHILTKKHMTQKYETLIEEEVRQAKLYYSQLNKVGEYSDPVALADKLVGTKSETEEVVEEDSDVKTYISRVGSYQTVSVDTSGETKSREERKMVSKPAPDEDMETFEQRLIDEAKQEVEATKQRLGIFEEDEPDIDDPDEEDDDFVEEEIVTMNVFTTQENAERSGNRPYIISAQEFNDGDLDYNQNTLTYFDGDDVLVDDRDQPIHHLNKIVGSDNLKFGQDSDDPNIVYIRNNELEVDFEVSRSRGKFAEEVLGFSEPKDKPRPRKFRAYD